MSFPQPPVRLANKCLNNDPSQPGRTLRFGPFRLRTRSLQALLPQHSCSNPMARHAPTPHKFPGTIFPTIAQITSGLCSPELPSNVYDRSKPLGPALHLPAVICLGADNRNFPIPWPFRKHMLNGCHHVRPQRRVPRVMHLHQNCHTKSLRHWFRVYTHPVNSWKGETR
jgi:hypothetical protein